MASKSKKAYDELIRRSKEDSLLGSCASLLGWDERTYMPKGGSAHRAEQFALLAGMIHEKATAPEIDELLSEAEGSDLVKDPRSAAAVNVREIRWNYDRIVRLPKKLVEELARVTTLAQPVWVEARAESDFEKFRPILEQIVQLKRQKAAALVNGEATYDALLEDYEPGATIEELTRVLGGLREELVPLVKEIVDSGRKPDASILTRDFPVDRQEAFGKAAASAIGFDFDRGRLDVTTHPFCTGIGPGDTRLTTRYNKNHFSEAFFGIMHEAGHGIYDQGTDDEQFGTPMGESVSLGIHESQSRMWENFVGRSAGFWSAFFPKAQEAFPEALGDVSQDAFLFSINFVRPSLIRVEADEATYNLHILLRFELEQALISGDLPPGDVPGAWNERFERYFGMRPPDDAQGCLQDIHWSFGSIGYFPTYSLGNLYAGQFFEQAQEDLGDLESQFAKGEFRPLKDWLTEKIHRQGMRFRAADLVREVTGKPLSHRPLMDHLKTKYSRLYGI